MRATLHALRLLCPLLVAGCLHQVGLEGEGETPEGLRLIVHNGATPGWQVFSVENLRFVWLFVFSMFLLAAFFIARYCWRTGAMLKELLGEGEAA